MFKSLLIAVITISSLCFYNVSFAGDTMDWYQAKEMIKIEKERNELLKEQIEQNKRLQYQLREIQRQQNNYR